MSRVAVRLDASAKVGTGHWRRMGNLVDALRPEHAVFIVRTDAPDNSIFRPASVRFLDDSDEFATIQHVCTRASIDLLITDLLRYPPGYQARLREALTCRIVSFHEYRDWDDLADLIVNFNIFDGFADISSPKILAGPDYCIINPEILSLASSPITDEVLLTFGGADPSAFAEFFVNEVVPHAPSIRFVLHEGPLGRRCVADLPSNVRRSHTSESFFGLMARCRAAVTAAGNSLYELIYLRRPVFVVAHNDHQAEFAANAARLGVAQFFGSAPNVDWTALISSLHRATPPASQAPSLIDGLGLNRIISRIRPLVA